MFGSFGWMELLLILFIVLIIFGAGKIPQLGEGLGKAIKGFKKSVHEADAIDVTASQADPNQQAQINQAQSQAPPLPGQGAGAGTGTQQMQQPKQG
ncbi:MAG: twin-arginine translocase TatA/TatE family subunit [Nitrospiraceae bacterium]